ncbi:hypothetical protein LXL04_015989 [Taraxacum kok-saghyz]
MCILKKWKLAGMRVGKREYGRIKCVLKVTVKAIYTGGKVIFCEWLTRCLMLCPNEIDGKSIWNILVDNTCKCVERSPSYSQMVFVMNQRRKWEARCNGNGKQYSGMDSLWYYIFVQEIL